MDIPNQTLAADATPGGEQTLSPPLELPLPADDPNPELQLKTVPSDEMRDTATDLPVATAVPAEDCHLKPASGALPCETQSGQHRFEIIPGLWAQLSDDAVITRHDNMYRQETDIVVRAKNATLGGYFFVGENISLRAKIQNCSNSGDIVVSDLIVSIEKLALDPLVDRDQAAKFLEEFGCGSPEPDAESAAAPKRPLPSRRLNREEFEEFLRNVRHDVRPARDEALSNNVGGGSKQNGGSEEVPLTASQQRADFKIPCAKVHAMKCRLPNESSVDFPGCVGSADCTLRVLLEYYCQGILNAMDLRSGDKAEVNAKTATADITSVGGSIVGAAAGAAVLGPVGFVAGSFLGSHFGRKHSGSIAGATAGAALFGPIGLMAGACLGESTRQLDDEKGEKSKSVVIDSSKGVSRGVARAASEHISSNKYEYAGSAGVVAGATAGSVLGPVGFVAGAYLGSVSARKMVETASNSKNSKEDDAGGTNQEKPYQFGDITRGIVARGKESRGVEAKDGYQFGDFTRGLFSGGKGK